VSARNFSVAENYSRGRNRERCVRNNQGGSRLHI
jgi:hypothetical protein